MHLLSLNGFLQKMIHPRDIVQKVKAKSGSRDLGAIVKKLRLDMGSPPKKVLSDPVPTTSEAPASKPMCNKYVLPPSVPCPTAVLFGT